MNSAGFDPHSESFSGKFWLDIEHARLPDANSILEMYRNGYISVEQANAALSGRQSRPHPAQHRDDVLLEDRWRRQASEDYYAKSHRRHF